MIDLHTHTTFSDGVLIPAETVRRAKAAGYKAIALTDHADLSNLEFILANVGRLAAKYSPYCGVDIFFGVEITHVPPGLIPETAALARQCGAQIVVAHGETVVEPVETGTNLAAIKAGVDILAHPGLITPEEVKLAAKNNVCLEISTRHGHSLSNGLVASLAREHGAKLVINNDAHAPGDFISKELRRAVAIGAGLTEDEYRRAETNSQHLVQRMIQRLRKAPG